MHALDLVRLALPLVVGFGVGRLCPMVSAGRQNPATPPGWVFGVVWTILYILIGVAWIFAARHGPAYDVAFTVLVLVLAGWIVAFSCRGSPRAALYVLLVSVLVTAMLIFSLIDVDRAAMLMLVPLLIWLIFALMLNYSEVTTDFSARTAKIQPNTGEGTPNL